MVDKEDKDFDQTLYNLRYYIRETMQAVQLQFDIMHEAIEKCGDITQEINYIGCIGATNTASNEILKFQELTKKLAEQIKDLNTYVKSKQYK